VSLPGRNAWPQGQHGLRAVQCLNLALFVDTQHQRFVGWVQIEANDIVELFDKLLVATELECFHQVRLEAVLMPNAPDRGFAQALCLGHGSCTPVCRIGRCRVQRRFHNGGNLSPRNPLNPAGTRRIFLQARQAQRQEAVAPKLNRRARYVQPSRNLLVLNPISGQADQLRPLDQSQRQASRCRPSVQRGSFFGRQGNRSNHPLM